MPGLYGERNTIEDIKRILYELLKDDIGTVKGKGSTRPAIFVEPPNTPRSADGLQCVIQRQPRQFSGQRYYWEVVLIAHNAKEDGIQIFDRAIAKMRRRFPINREVAIPYSENEPPQIQFSLFFHYNAYPYS